MLCALRDLVKDYTREIKGEDEVTNINDFLEYINGFITKNGEGLLILGDNKNNDRIVFREILNPDSDMESKEQVMKENYKRHKIWKNYKSLRTNLAELCKICGLTSQASDITKSISLIRIIIRGYA